MEENEQSIDLRVLLKVLRDHVLPIAAAAVAAALVGLILSAVIIPKKYTSEALMYVENNNNADSNSSLNINDINAAQKIVNTCQILFTSHSVLRELQTSFDNFSISELKEMIVIESVNSTEVLRISVTSLSPQISADMAARMVELSTSEFQRVLKNGSIELVSSPTTGSLTFPSVPQFTIIGLLIGLVVSYVVFLIIELIDVKVKPGDDLMQMYGIPVFAEIMDFELSDKGSYKYHYYSTSTPETGSTKPKSASKSQSSSHSSSGSDKGSSGKRKENA